MAPTTGTDGQESAPSSGFAEVNGTRLYYEVAGAGEPLVLIHGYTLDTRMWDDQIDAFAQGNQVIRYDLRGFGRSALPTGEAFTHHEDLSALLAFLQVERAHILGLSLEGKIAINFALTYPAATRSLIPVDVSALEGYEWPDELRRWFAPIISAARDGDMALAKQRWLAVDWFASARGQPDVAARLAQIVADYSGWHFANRSPEQTLTPPAYARLEEIGAPALIIIGELDLPFYNHPIADALQQRIPGARKVVMPGVGHMVNMEDPAGFNEIVTSFIKTVE